ncbi:MAG: response regulator [Verrucomicrobiota bacterium]
MPKKPPEIIEILLFEDNAADADLVAEYLDLSLLDHKITTVKRLREGLDQIGTGQFHVVLLDLSLPDSRGIETFHRLLEKISDEVVIILTGADDEQLSLQALQAGAQDYLFKDRLSGEVLRRSIRYAIERSNLTTKLERYTSELEHREALLRRIFDANTDAMLILTPEYEIKFFNSSAAALLEIEESSLVGETFPFEVSTSQISELEIPEPGGSSHLVEISAVDLVWEGESALLVSLRDITQRRSAELELKREKERLTVTLDSIVDAVIATDKNGTVERMNQEASRLTGSSNQEALGKPLGQVLKLKNPDSGTSIKDPTKDLLSPEYTESYSKAGLPLERGQGRAPLLVTAEMRAIRDEEGGYHGCVTVLRDITKQKKAEEELFKTEKLNSVSLLAGGIAHDFNNMLTAILGNISVARMDIDAEDPNSRKLLAAEKAALQAKSLTQQLLTFSKGGAPVLEVTTIDKLVEESAQFSLRGSNVKCQVTKGKDIWAVDADKGQISQVVNNLIINADQAMPTGGNIQLHLENSRVRHSEIPALKAGAYVCIKVEDEGVGISSENIKRIFDPYFTTKDEGNGLGLASSYSIVKSHQGAMTVESEVGKGTAFRVYLPKTQNEKAAAKRPAESEPSTDQSESIHKGHGRILVMDDMEAMMLVAGEILNVLGYEVEFSTNGEEAITAYKEAKESGKPFRAVVFDLTVPGAMGGEKASEILIEYDPDLIAIASSGYATSNVMSDYENSAFKAAVPKPYRIKEMSDALHRVLK